ncbi:DNA mismatch repair endonuclease MutL [Shouchella sp. 1P09AA]|uniref:DNA mismatch repair endonuclease MutL n=1 Tax=unclassified Shouchella TaxID=2893065 RepID=UPI0039A231B6
MQTIRQLHDSLSNKIAAGEVVERPASIVKELIENAVDAGATQLLIEIVEGGMESIRIVDNGHGIKADEVETAFLRHATSKLQHDRDLFSIRTLGFRGEALPSIASVSTVTMQTSTGNQGVELTLHGGEVVERQPSSAKKGTSIFIKDLFYNTPARLKYLKTKLTESGHVSDVVNRMALAYPSIAFHYTSDGKTVLKTTGNDRLLQVIAEVYGRQTASTMVSVEGESLDYQLTGYVAKPELTRASRQYMSIFINGRYIRNYKLAQAIQQGFHTLLPIGRYPLAILKLQMDPTLIDVNVHPAKLEVRLSKEEALAEVITRSIKDVFAKETLIPQSTKQPDADKKPSEQLSFSLNYPAQPKEERFTEPEAPVIYEPTPNYVENDQPKVASLKETVQSEVGEREEPNKGNDSGQETLEKQDQTTDLSIEDVHQVAVKVEEHVSTVPPLYPVGQMHGTYIVAQNENGMYLIDQHAAQERIKYEYFRKKLHEPISTIQDLLVPLTLEFTAREAAVIEESTGKLEAVGLILEPFGIHTYMVRSHPTWFPKGDEESSIREIIDQLLQTKQINLYNLREEAAILMSCKAAIKANRHLRHDEMFELLETLRRCEEPYTCPHGRPIIIHFTTYELEKMFKRVM